ncbi:Glutathione-dependent peroxiredoxin [Balamuthia mandrillaris]
MLSTTRAAALRSSSALVSGVARPSFYARSYAVGQNLLEGKANLKDDSGKDISLQDLFKGKKVVIFGLPGAYTPVCTTRHVPLYVEKAPQFKAKGIDTIACVSVNDPFVMKAWGESLKAGEAVKMLADWDGSFTKLVEKELDLSAAGLGKRCKRYALVVDNGKIVKENVENAPNDLTITAPDHVLSQL